MEFNKIKSVLKRHLFADKYIEEAYAKIARLRQERQHVQEDLDKLRESYKTLQGNYADLEQQFSCAKSQNTLSYAQAGEDRVVSYIFQELGITEPTYLDIGANYPTHLSNTFLFYLRGCKGVCIEPDPELYRDLLKVRERDVCLNIGIGISDASSAPFYVFEENAKGLNTFSKKQAELAEGFGRYKVTHVLQIPLRNVNAIIKENFVTHPNFLSIDVEGLDFEILKTLDFETYPIEVVCAETITYSSNGTEEKIQPILDLMLSKGYSVFADTHINTIFVKNKGRRN